ncbi:MAG: peptidylprolyl isomerase [Gammaproteobacteria bacterium]|jgi:FKBP-type peptidyl-prolyl cis-trans isomerase SlyD|nr:peptidylprolyl isomerase [Gammaproteobacteria bacterium]
MSEERIQDGKYVSLTYRIADETGGVLEHSDLPVSFIVGGNQELIGGMDAAIRGKQAGDEVNFELSPEQGFGHHDPDLTFADDINNVPPQFRHVGAEVQMQNEAGEIKTFFVSRIENGRLTIDGNHPLAGKRLQVHVRISEVREATREDLAQDGQACAIPPALH